MGMKRNVLVGAAVGTTVFGAVFGLAAGLDVSSQDKLGSGQASVSSCDPDGVAVNYVFDGATYVTGIEVTGISDQCDGAMVSVAASGPNAPDTIGSGSSPISTYSMDELEDNNHIIVALEPSVTAAQLSQVTVTLHGGHSPSLDLPG